MNDNPPTTDVETLCCELERGILALQGALLAQNVEAVEEGTVELNRVIARWRKAAPDTIYAEQLRGQALALRIKNLHNGKLLLADLKWMGAMLHWLQQGGEGSIYSPNGPCSPRPWARWVDYRG
jgi:hypothetical protein